MAATSCPPTDLRDECGHELGLVQALAVLGLVAGLFGDLPVLTVRVERDTVPVRVPILPWPRHVRSVDVAVQCDSDEPAAEVANRLGLTLVESRRFPSAATRLEFVQSTWAGWLTTSDAASVGLPVSVTVAGCHVEPAPVRREPIDAGATVEAVA